MNSIDIAILLIVGFFAVKGLFRGLVIEVLTLAGLIAGYIAAITYMSSVSNMVGKFIHVPSFILSSISFFLIFIIVVAVVRWVAIGLKKIFKWYLIGWIDKTGGFFFGIFKGTVVASLIVLLLSLLPLPESIEKEKRSSFLFEPVSVVAPAIFNSLKIKSHEGKSFYDEIKEGLKDTTEQIQNRILLNRLESLKKKLESGDRKERTF